MVHWLLAAAGAASIGSALAAGQDPTVGVVIGLANFAAAAVLARRSGASAWGLVWVAIIGVPVTAIVFRGAFTAWTERIRRDVAQDAAFLRDGVLVRADPSPAVSFSDVRGTEYCATMHLDPVWGGFRGQTGQDFETVDGKLLTTERCDLTPSLLERLERAVTERVEVDIVVLPSPTRDQYGRPRLDGFRLPDEIGWVDPLASLDESTRAQVDQLFASVATREWGWLRERVGATTDRELLDALGLGGVGRVEDLKGLRIRGVDHEADGSRLRFDAILPAGERVPGSVAL